MTYIPPNPNGQATSANSAPVVIASDQSAIQTKLSDGSQIANTVAGDTGQNALITTGWRKELSGSASSAITLIASTDVSNYASVSVQISGTFVLTYAFQGSNDGSTWVNQPLSRQSNAEMPPGSSTFSNSIYSGPLTARYFRVQVTSYTSGTVTAVAEFTNRVAPLYNTIMTVDTELPAVGNATDTYTAPTTVGIINMPYGFNGSTWDRNRVANSAAGTTGTGVPASGALAFDGTNYQRLKSDTTGVLATNLSPSTSGGWSVSSQTSVTTTATVSSAAGKFGGGSFLNLNSAPAYLQVFDTTGAVTLGTTAPTFVQPIPANSVAANGLGYVFEIANGIAMTSGIKIAATTTPTGSTTISAGLVGFVMYK